MIHDRWRKIRLEMWIKNNLMDIWIFHRNTIRVFSWFFFLLLYSQALTLLFIFSLQLNSISTHISFSAYTYAMFPYLVWKESYKSEKEEKAHTAQRRWQQKWRHDSIALRVCCCCCCFHIYMIRQLAIGYNHRNHTYI